MKTIELFHSYNFVTDKFTHKNKNFYDKHENLIFSLLNIPSTLNNDLYSIKIQNILQKKIFSKKKNKKSYYTKHNIKIFLIINYNKLYNYVSNKINIPDFNILFKLITTNYFKLDKNTFIHNVVCVNKGFKKKIAYVNSIVNNFNYYDLYDLKLDILNKTITHTNSIIYKKYIINGTIICYDILPKLIKELLGLNLKNVLFICSKYQSKFLDNYNLKYISADKSINSIHSNKIWDHVILLNLDDEYLIKDLKYNSIFVCINKITNIKIDDLLYYYNKYYNIDLYKYQYINDIMVYNLIKNIIFRHYSHKLVKINTIKLKKTKALNINSIIQANFTETICTICYNNNVNVKTKCNHYFCSDCINKLMVKNKIICPICRLNNNMKHLNYVVKDCDKINISNHYKYVIKKSMKQNITLISNNDKTIKYIKELYNHYNLTSHIYNINSIKSLDYSQIYILESKENIDINKIYNMITKKSVIHFFHLE